MEYITISRSKMGNQLGDRSVMSFSHFIKIFFLFRTKLITSYLNIFHCRREVIKIIMCFSRKITLYLNKTTTSIIFFLLKYSGQYFLIIIVIIEVIIIIFPSVVTYWEILTHSPTIKIICINI